MIGYLSGKVNFKNGDNINILISGIGYNVYVPSSIISTINLSDNLSLFIYTHVREDTLDLYGFKTQDELEIFKKLMSVSGVGAKTALNIVDRGVENIKNAIIKADVDFFTIIPRLGKKNAQKIIIELKSKIGSLNELDLATEVSGNSDVIDALVAMGYSKQDTIRILRKLPDSVSNIEDKIRFVIKNLGKGLK